ncbi:MFS transporter [Desulfosporosinus sp. Sb-LF]|uniref:MFS transporter n=1 Tax=Desulfosporosinus sp. Sb-LF TaxID=2560027 RepID=UPI00107FC463|nr:MFS transporter [Desulfosporosinus sp. Sb-LF]TGE32125.1 DHA2 family efflux MFS transporter permease subunit [Desulfosporosinus sp. Sb-LF]
MKENSLRSVLIVVMITSFLAPFTGNAINIAIPAIAGEFHSTPVMLNMVVASYIIASAAFLLPFGRLGDIVGRRKVFVVGMFLFSITSFLCAIAFSLQSLILFRVLQGVASSMIFGTSMAILISFVPPQERGKVIGLTVSTTYLGLSLGPVLGGFITAYLSWRVIFCLNCFIGLFVAVFTLLKVREDSSGTQEETFDLIGSILCVAGIVSILYGVSTISTVPLARFILLAGLVLFVVFIRYEMTLKFPLIKIEMFTRNIPFAFSNLAALVNYAATFASTFMMSLYLQTVMGFSPEKAGLILLAQPIVMAILSPYAGKLSDRMQPRIVASWGMGITTIGLFFFIFLSDHSPVVLIIANLMMIGVGFALFSSPNTKAVMSSVSKSFYGVASSTLGTMRLVGQAISMTIVTLITSLFMKNLNIGSADYATQYLKSSKIAFLVFTVICCAGIIASLARGSMESSNNNL